MVWLVRHGCAGSRQAWEGDDDLRPLDRAGMAQARLVATLLTPSRPTALLSSPARRCLQTLEPLSVALGRPVVVSDVLRAGTDVEEVLGLAAAASVGTVLCTHGEVLADVLDALRADHPTGRGDLHRDDQLLAKGATWRLDLAEGRAVPLTSHLARDCPEHDTDVV